MSESQEFNWDSFDWNGFNPNENETFHTNQQEIHQMNEFEQQREEQRETDEMRELRRREVDFIQQFEEEESQRNRRILTQQDIQEQGYQQRQTETELQPHFYFVGEEGDEYVPLVLFEYGDHAFGSIRELNEFVEWYFDHFDYFEMFGIPFQTNFQMNTITVDLILNEDDLNPEMIQKAIAHLLGFVVPLNQFQIVVDFTLEMEPGLTRRIMRPLPEFIRPIEGIPCYFFATDVQRFWQMYEEETYGFYQMENLVEFHLIIQLPAIDLNDSGERFPLLVKSKEFAPYRELFHLLQIFYDDEEIPSSLEHCFVHSLQHFNVLNQHQIDQIKLLVKRIVFTSKTLNQITTNFNIKIELYLQNGTIKEYGTNQRQTCSIGLIQYGAIKHYFPMVKCMGYSSMEIIQAMIEEKEFIQPSLFIPTTKYELIDRLNVISLNKCEMRTMKRKEKEKEKQQELKDYCLIFADFECFTQGEQHEPFCLCWKNTTMNRKGHEYGMECAKRFIQKLNELKRDCLVYFHNLSYDGRFLLWGKVESVLLKQRKIYSLVLKTDSNHKLHFKDSYAIITHKLALFPQMFGLETTGPKEIFPYNYYSRQTYMKGTIEECWKDEKPKWNEEQIDHFKRNLKELNCLKSDGIHFDAKKYCLYYCERDVEILEQGFLKFKTQLQEHFDLDATEFLTISSLANAHFKQSVYLKQDVFEYNGFIREWIRQAVIGGRCMTRQNKKWKVEEEIVDFDACSLYPSAMHRLHLPLGKPFILDKSFLDAEFLLQHTMHEDELDAKGTERWLSCFIVKIKIISIQTELDFPLIIHKTPTTRDYVNEIGHEMVVDNIYLEDLMFYHGAQVEVVEGIGWRGKKENLMSKEIQRVYEKRAELKRQKNKAETIYKLIMNSTYGKTIQKMPESEQMIVNSKQEMEEYVTTNFELVKEIEELYNDHWLLTTYPQEDKMFIPDLVGCLILSMSKRIMNEVFYCCNKQGIPVYYQDTDSIHIPKNRLNDLQQEFQFQFERELIGTQMGQFHSDFDPVKGKESWAKRSLFVGKKCYFDLLTNEDGDEKAHFRLKGIPQEVIEEKAKEEYNGSIEALYEALMEGKEIEFNLLSTRVRFDMKKDFRIVNKNEFLRKVKF